VNYIKIHHNFSISNVRDKSLKVVKFRRLKLMNMNKVLLVLIITSGFLLIIYANTDIFSRKNLLAVLQKSYKSTNHNHEHNNHKFNDFDDILDDNTNNNIEQNDDSNNKLANYVTKVKYIPKINKTEYNVFIIYTKENSVLKNKFELFLKSLLKHTTIPLHLHIISDEKSELSAEEVIKTQINHYRKIVFYTMVRYNWKCMI
jgi:xylosyl alpha-1,3-xylosyltransferase